MIVVDALGGSRPSILVTDGTGSLGGSRRWSVVTDASLGGSRLWSWVGVVDGRW